MRLASNRNLGRASQRFAFSPRERNVIRPSASSRRMSQNPSSQVKRASLPTTSQVPGELGAWCLFAPDSATVK